MTTPVSCNLYLAVRLAVLPQSIAIGIDVIMHTQKIIMFYDVIRDHSALNLKLEMHVVNGRIKKNMQIVHIYTPPPPPPPNYSPCDDTKYTKNIRGTADH